MGESRTFYVRKGAEFFRFSPRRRARSRIPRRVRARSRAHKMMSLTSRSLTVRVNIAPIVDARLRRRATVMRDAARR